MLLKCDLDIFDICQHMPFDFRKVVEVGVGEVGDCRVSRFIEAGCDVTLIEPYIKYYDELIDAFGKNQNVSIFNVAIADREGTSKLALRGQSSFLIDDVSTAPVLSDRYDGKPFDRIQVDTNTFNKYDDGDIDLLLLDMEGSEWFVLKHMKSRPRVIAVETHHEDRYTNPFINEINAFMDRHVYKVLFRNTSDTFFIRGNDLGWGPGGNGGWNLG